MFALAPFLPAASRRPRPPARLFGALACAAVALGPAGPVHAQLPSFGPPVPVDPGAAADAHGDELPRVAWAGDGAWIVVWQASAATDLGLGRDVDVVWARSTDSGAHWTPPRPMADAFATDRGEDREPSVACDGSGRCVVAWSSASGLAGDVRRDRDIMAVASSDHGQTWGPPHPVNTNAATDWGDDESVDLAVDSRGRWVAVWESSDTLGNTKGGDRDILFATSTDGGAAWSAPHVVDEAALKDTDFDTAPRVGVDGRGAWLVAWSNGRVPEDRTGYERGALVARSVDGGETWETPVAVGGKSPEDRPDFAPRVAGDAGGHWACVWASTDSLGGKIGKDGDLLMVRSADEGRSWGAPEVLNREAAEDLGDDDRPELVVDGAGNWVVAWTSWDRRGALRGADADLLVSMSRDMGATWTRSVPLNTNAQGDRGEDLGPSLATDGHGTWMAAWSTTALPGQTLGQDRDILAASGRFGQEVVGPPVP